MLSGLPIALEREDLRVVHAAWQAPSIESARRLPLGAIQAEYDHWEVVAHQRIRELALDQRMRAELMDGTLDLEDPSRPPPFLHAHAEQVFIKQMLNPLKVLTSGVERKGTVPFYSGGKWRFNERVAWWDHYEDATPVVVGHYWRRINKVDRATLGKGDQDLFENTHPVHWHGKAGKVFCVDFSAGGRWSERKAGTPVGKDFKLAALRWPEQSVHFDDGQVHGALGFGMETCARCDQGPSTAQGDVGDNRPHGYMARAA